jgi:hypothetical protein
MTEKIVRTVAEIAAARDRARKASFALEDAEGDNAVEETSYQTLQWVLGNTDVDPTVEMGADDEDDPDEE